MLFGLARVSAGNTVTLSVTLPSTSTLLPKVSLVNSAGLPVPDEDGNANDGHFQGTVPMVGAYYARVQAIADAEGTDTAGAYAQYLLEVELLDDPIMQATVVEDRRNNDIRVMADALELVGSPGGERLLGGSWVREHRSVDGRGLLEFRGVGGGRGVGERGHAGQRSESGGVAVQRGGQRVGARLLQGGPGGDAFISHYAIPSSGTYYVYVGRYS